MLQKRVAETATKHSEAGDDATPRRIFRDCPDCPQMIVVPRRTMHKVTLIMKALSMR
jgi:hypothetical protein